MLTPKQMTEIDAAMLEPDDLMDAPALCKHGLPESGPCDDCAAIQEGVFPPTELDQLATLANAVLMLESAAKEIEARPAGHSAEAIAYGIRCRCEGWRENINQRLRLLKS